MATQKKTSTAVTRQKREHTTDKGTKVTFRTIKGQWHPHGGEALAIASVGGRRVVGTATGTSVAQAKINAKLSAISFASALGL